MDLRNDCMQVHEYIDLLWVVHRHECGQHQRPKAQCGCFSGTSRVQHLQTIWHSQLQRASALQHHREQRLCGQWLVCKLQCMRGMASLPHPSKHVAGILHIVGNSCTPVLVSIGSAQNWR